MATHQKIQIRTDIPSTGVFERRPFEMQMASCVSDLLQRNHDSYHIYIHNLGLHNHILHHLLALFSLGGTSRQIEQAYNLAAGSQRPSRAPDLNTVSDLADPFEFKKYLGKGRNYDDYFAFFQNEMSLKGVANTVNEYLFKGDERAEDMLRRFFSGFLHSPIHLGYAIEFDQPLIAAEALALTAVHDSGFGDILAMVEDAAIHSSESKGLAHLQQEIYTNSKLRDALVYEHGVFQVRDGALTHAKDEFLRILGLWKVSPDEIKNKTAESLNATIYWTALAQRPDRQIRFDFFLMHSITAGSLWPALNSASWISTATKCRLLEWKGRSDLMLYYQSGAPQLYPEELSSYRPSIPSGWSDIFHRACDYQDDGHLVKFIRGIATAAEDIKLVDKGPRFQIKSSHDFLTIAHMVIDSAEEFNRETANDEAKMICSKYEYPRLMSPEIQRVTARWPRHVGFQQSWFHVPMRKRYSPTHL